MPALSLPHKIASNLFFTLAVAVAMIGGVLTWLATEADRQAIEATQRMVHGGLDQNLDAIKRNVNDCAFWEDAWKAATDGDRDWLDANMGSGVTESVTVDAIAIVSPTLLVKHEWITPGESVRKPLYFPADLLTQIEKVGRNRVARPDETQTFFWKVGQSVVAYAVQRLTPTIDSESSVSAKRDYLIFAKILTPNDVLRIGSMFLLNDLAIKAPQVKEETVKEKISLNLLDPQKTAIAEFIWSAPQPGTALLMAVAFPVGLAFLVLVLSGSWTTWRASILAKQLQSEKQFAVKISQTDALTGLANRVGFYQFLNSNEVRELASLGAFAVWQIDLNNFKAINGSMGHTFGDALIVSVSKSLQEVLPANTYIARSGSKEFLIAGLGFELVERAAQVAQKLGTVLSKGHTINSHNIDVSSAISYAIATEQASNPQDVVHRSGLAMTQAKEMRLNGVMAYDKGLEASLQEAHEIEAVLQKAIATNGFEVHYQPVFNTLSGEIDHAEALVRLSPKMGKNFGPDRFIAVAEKTGLIQDIGLIVLNQVAHDARQFPNLKIAVNLSPVQLLNFDFVKMATSIVEKAGLVPANIAFELTEGVLIDSPDLARRQLDALSQQGFEIYLDDFGSGFSSIGYLNQFPFNALKIDRSVIQAAFETEKGLASLVAIASLAKAMNISMFAEGVENQKQFEFLADLGCNWLQGWHIGKPINVSGFSASIDRFMATHSSSSQLRRKAEEMRGYISDVQPEFQRDQITIKSMT